MGFNMLKLILSTLIITVFFSACSSTSPKKFDKQSELNVANTCSKLEVLDKKLECYTKIVDENSVAQLRLGIYNAQKKEFKKALVLLEQAKANGNFYANLPIGYIYFKGDGVEKDLEKSFNYLSQTSDIDVNSSYQLSRFYLQGLVVEKDTKKGMNLLIDSANKGMRLAQSKLVTIYKQGSFGVSKNEKEALFWLNKVKENKNDNTFDIYKL
jgi:TPR repeat protein